MAYIVERSSRFYVVAYNDRHGSRTSPDPHANGRLYAVVDDGTDPLIGREQRSCRAAGPDRAEAEAMLTRLVWRTIPP